MFARLLPSDRRRAVAALALAGVLAARAAQVQSTHAALNDPLGSKRTSGSARNAAG